MAYIARSQSGNKSRRRLYNHEKPEDEETRKSGIESRALRHRTVSGVADHDGIVVSTWSNAHHTHNNDATSIPDEGSSKMTPTPATTRVNPFVQKHGLLKWGFSPNSSFTTPKRCFSLAL